MKQIFKILLGSCLSLFLFSGSLLASNLDKQNLSFTDVSTNLWYYPYIQYLYDNNDLDGITENEFAPNQYITRAEFIKLLANAVNEDASKFENTTFSFTDVPVNSWFTNYIRWAYNNNIIFGKSNAIFGPNEYITREEAAVTLYRVSQKYSRLAMISDSITFSDQVDISAWANEAVTNLQKANIINGYDHRFLPKNSITRAEAAKIITGYIQLDINSSPQDTENFMAEDISDPTDNSKISIFSIDFSENNFCLSAARTSKNVNNLLDLTDTQISDFISKNTGEIMASAESVSLDAEDTSIKLSTTNTSVSSYNTSLGTNKAYFSGNYWNSGLTASQPIIMPPMRLGGDRKVMHMALAVQVHGLLPEQVCILVDPAVNLPKFHLKVHTPER